MDKKEIIGILEEIGTMLELKGENPFKSRAYFYAARTLETMTDDIRPLILSRQIEGIKGIGKAISEKLYTLLSTGRLPYYEDLRSAFPEGLFELLNIPGLGPKKVKALYETLNITSVGELEYACQENRLRDLPGFGQRSQDKILEGIQLRKRYKERFLYPVARTAADAIRDYLQKHPKVEQVEIAGSLRRRCETAKDIDLVGSCPEADREEIMAWFTRYPETETITGQGLTKSGIILNSGMGCDLRLVNRDQYAFALHHFTGSKEHNTAMRQRAKFHSLTMNEYGLFREGEKDPVTCASEEEIFRFLELAYIPPELRENRGEIEAAASGRLPILVGPEDIRGILHVHTTYSDGASSISEMAEHCRALGYSYIGITDHSKSAFYANGLTEDRILKQHEEIDRLNASLSGFIIFKGIEADILPDGSLDYEDRILERFDFIIASVHSSFNLSESEMTRRICRALEHPAVTILGHPTGRLLLGREPYKVDIETVLETAGRFGKAVEINANPHRLDLDWRWGSLAKKLRVKTAINPDAHSASGLKDIETGIGIARKAWFEKDSVLNTFPADTLGMYFKHR